MIATQQAIATALVGRRGELTRQQGRTLLVVLIPTREAALKGPATSHDAI